MKIVKTTITKKKHGAEHISINLFTDTFIIYTKNGFRFLSNSLQNHQKKNGSWALHNVRHKSGICEQTVSVFHFKLTFSDSTSNSLQIHTKKVAVVPYIMHDKKRGSVGTRFPGSPSIAILDNQKYHRK